MSARSVLGFAVVAACFLAPAAQASSIVTTENVVSASLKVTRLGEAIVTYRAAGGRTRHVIAWGAVNAVASSPGAKQVAFTYDYTGGYQAHYATSPEVRRILAGRRRDGTLPNATYARLARLRALATGYWRTGSCTRYDGPPLAWLVAACKAPDGSYWALQSWQRTLPNYGLAPAGTQGNWELHLAHWTGELPQLTLKTDWSWRQWQHLYGLFTYAQAPVFGFRSTSTGAPLDRFGRNVYLDTYDSPYGAGWRRENSFLTHRGTGVFCYSVNPHGDRPAGGGSHYRATIIGPGVTPDVMWSGAGPGPFDPAADFVANAEIRTLGDTLCRPN